MSSPKILAFAGSARSGSFNKKIIAIAAAGARSAGAEVTLIDLRDFPLPLFDQDLEASQGLPENGRKLKDIFLAHQGLLIASPEHNSSITAVLKNTIDWVSRPVAGAKSLAEFTGKVAGIMSASPGALGGLRGLVQLRSILSNIGVLVIPQQTAINKAGEAFTPEGELKDAAQKASLERIGSTVFDLLKKIYA
jgi:chromate reductase, NAD(P)H dehydrogenase (quinone)